MGSVVIRDRGRGPEIAGSRITVYHLLPYFLDPSATEEYIGRVHGLTAEEVASARSYVLNNPDVVLAEHLEIEARIADGNPPQVIARTRNTRETFARFKEWLARRDDVAQQIGVEDRRLPPGLDPELTFQDWLGRTESRPVEGP